MANFYVTLPSNASMDIYPENAISHYTTSLREPLDLTGSWEVGLVEISFPSRVENVDINSRIRTKWELPDNKKKPTKLIMKYVREDVSQENVYDGRQLAHAMNKAWKKMKDTIGLYNPSQLEIVNNVFIFHPDENIITLNKKFPSVMEVSGGLGLVLGIGDGTKEWVDVTKNKNKANQVANLNVLINHVYVYSDIAKYVMVGDQVAPLLRIVPLQSYVGNNRLDHYTHIYNNPHYVPVSRQHIESIHIDLRSDTGQYVPFTTGRSFVKVHFRQKRVL